MSVPAAPGTRADIALRLAEPQRMLYEAFAKAGLTFDAVAQTLFEVMTSPLQVKETDADGNSITTGVAARDKVAAAHLAIVATTGLAPTNAKNLHLHAHTKSDRFFDPERIAPPPRTD